MPLLGDTPSASVLIDSGRPLDGLCVLLFTVLIGSAATNVLSYQQLRADLMNLKMLKHRFISRV